MNLPDRKHLTYKCSLGSFDAGGCVLDKCNRAGAGSHFKTIFSLPSSLLSVHHMWERQE